MLNLDESWTCHLRASLWFQSSRSIQSNSQGLSHTGMSSRHSLVTRVHSQSVEHNHSGITASCSIVLRAQLQVAQLDIQDTIWMIFILKIISKLCSAENNICESEASEQGHIVLLFCLPSQKYISMTHYFY